MPDVIIEVEAEFLGKYDKMIGESGFKHRSEAIREAMRDHFDKLKRRKGYYGQVKT